jgi:hypothetical protein
MPQTRQLSSRLVHQILVATHDSMVLGAATRSPQRLSDCIITVFRIFLFLVACSFAAFGQGNYEIQVYGSDTVAAGNTMFELHSNYTAEGSKITSDGTYPTNHQQHETLEITQGWNAWFETGLYIFTSVGPGQQGYKWVGDHIRPRVRVPEWWRWPVGVSLSTEFGYQRPIFSRDTWTWEIRPIIDKQLGPWYFAFNPALERSFHGPSVPQGVTFSPAVKVLLNSRSSFEGQISQQYFDKTEGDIIDSLGVHAFVTVIEEQHS